MMNDSLSIKNRYLIRWVGRCQYDTHDKIWGWFFYFQNGYKFPTDKAPICYTFWARTGKTPSFKKHDFNKWTIERHVRSKKDKSYKQISVSELEMLWPTLWSDIENKFIFHILSENI